MFGMENGGGVVWVDGQGQVSRVWWGFIESKMGSIWSVFSMRVVQLDLCFEMIILVVMWRQVGGG